MARNKKGRNSVATLFKPRSVAVIGASRTEGSVGHKIFQNLIEQPFRGPVFPVNPKAESILSVRAFASIAEIPDPVDLSVIVVPAGVVLEAVRQCGEKGVKAIIVVSAGFGESGETGMHRQKQLAAVCSRYGMRLVGPNCMGIINTSPEINLNATFSHVFPPRGNIAMATQSGALGLVILEYAMNLGIGLSTFVSVGNRADVSSNDLLEYWRDDSETEVIMLYLESFGNPVKFARLARDISLKKPIIALKSGRSEVGSRAAASHTGALATVDVAVDALFTQTGIIRVDSLEQLFDVSDILAHQPLPKGSRVAVLTNGGGPGALTADACSAFGLELPQLTEDTITGLTALLPERASLKNPVDITDVGAAEYRGALSLLAADSNIDSVIVIFIPPVFTRPEDIANVIKELAPEFRRRGKPLLASFMGQRGCVPGSATPAEGAGVPSFAFPEAAVYALARARDYGLIRRRREGKKRNFPGIDREKARAIVDGAGEGWLDPIDVFEILDIYGISVCPPRSAANIDESIEAAEEIGYPVTLKLDSASIAHKTELGGVELNIETPEELKTAYNRMMGRMEKAGRSAEVRGTLVQRMAPEGVEVIAGITHDDTFGSLILFGLGGIYTELFKDTVTRINPLTDIDALEMVRSVKARRLLEGFRGAPPSDIESIEDLLLRLSALAQDMPRIRELDLNPVRVFGVGDGYSVVDARVLI